MHESRVAGSVMRFGQDYVSDAIERGTSLVAEATDNLKVDGA